MVCPGRCANPFQVGLVGLVGLAVLTLVANPVPARAQDPLLARVLAIAPESVTLGRLSPGGGDADPDTRTLVVPLDNSGLPPGIRVGSLVRLWPGADPDQAQGRSSGARLDVLDGDATLQDRTGVRARLMRGAPGAPGGGGGGRGGR